MRRPFPEIPPPTPPGRPGEAHVRGLAIVRAGARVRGSDGGTGTRRPAGTTGRGQDGGEGGGQDGGADDRLRSALAIDLNLHFEALVLAFQDRLYGFALRLSANREDAEEIAQDAFVRAYRALRKYPPDRILSLSLRAWLYQIALNVARNRFRRKRHRLVSLDAPRGDTATGARTDPLDPADDPEKGPDRLFEKRRERADIATLVHALPDRYRAPLVLRYVEGLPVEEVATILGQPTGTAKSNLHRAVRALRESLSRSRSRSRSARPRAQEAIR